MISTPTGDLLIKLGSLHTMSITQPVKRTPEVNFDPGKKMCTIIAVGTVWARARVGFIPLM